VALATGRKGPRSIAVDSAYVYWIEFDGGSVNRVAIRGGDVTAIASDPKASPLALAIDEAWVYWTSADLGHRERLYETTVLAAPKTGGTPIALFAHLSTISNLAVDDEGVYLSYERSGVFTLARLPKTGGSGLTLDTVSAPSATGTEVAVHGGSVYWSGYFGPSAGASGGYRIKRIPIDGTGPAELVPFPDEPTTVVSDGDRLYYSVFGATADDMQRGGKIVSMSNKGTDVRILATDVLWPTWIAVSGDAVCFAARDGIHIIGAEG
jgi:hypothetical protein